MRIVTFASLGLTRLIIGGADFGLQNGDHWDNSSTTVVLPDSPMEALLVMLESMGFRPVDVDCRDEDVEIALLTDWDVIDAAKVRSALVAACRDPAARQIDGFVQFQGPDGSAKEQFLTATSAWLHGR